MKKDRGVCSKIEVGTHFSWKGEIGTKTPRVLTENAKRK